MDDLSRAIRHRFYIELQTGLLNVFRANNWATIDGDQELGQRAYEGSKAVITLYESGGVGSWWRRARLRDLARPV